MFARPTRRLLSTLSSTPNAFPPPEALSSATATKPFQAQVWASMQPPPESAISAFAARLRLFDGAPPSNLHEVMTKVFTHHSYIKLHTSQKPNEPLPATNKDLESIGNGLLGLFATEYVHAAYPHLPTRAVKAAVTAYVGPQTCADVAREWGTANLLRWHRTPKIGSRKPVLHSDAYASVPRSIVALAYQYGSLDHARELVHKVFLSRKVDLKSFVKFRNPMEALVDTALMFGREKPKSRLLKETGRMSISPVFVVGVFSGEEKLGEGFGSSLRMAEHRACEDALHRLYLTKTPAHELSVPTSTFSSSSGLDSFSTLLSPSVQPFHAVELGASEVLFGSAGRGKLSGRPGDASRQNVEQDD
ncbi:hypothetical protein FRC02_009500 [Tulasnella sp. 418]|nr:hypothetical protein FRC02_009500 [Tulasnella sp. 418]